MLLLASLVLLGFPAFAMRRGLHWGWVAGAPLLLFLGTLLFRGLFPLPSFVDTGLDNFAYNLAIVVAGSVLGLLVAFQDELLQRRRAAAREPAGAAAAPGAGGQEPPPAADGTASAGRRIVVVELALAAAIVFGLAGIVGYASAARVMHGELLRCGCVQVAKHNISLPWLSGTPGFLAVRVQRAEVVWNTPPQHPPSWLSLPMSAMYLGQADGMIVVYDPAQARPLRFPVGSVLVRVDPRPATFSESSSDDGY